MKTKIIQRILVSFTARQPRSVLECGSPLPLFGRGTPIHSGRALPHSKTWRSFAAVLALLVLLNSQSSTASAQNIFVANYVGGTVSEFDPSGNLITNSFAPGLNYPTGLAFDGSGNLYVANALAGTVSEFDSSGTPVNASFASGLNYPTGLACDSSNNLFVVDYGNSTVSEFNSSGSLIRTISGPGVNSPLLIAISPAPAQPAPAPPLGITMVGNLPVVVWPAASTNYVLQMTTNLASGNWVTVTNGIPFSGLQITNAPPGAAFFRLH
jgi:DNA-binding beta-propeller fold protein YncE